MIHEAKLPAGFPPPGPIGQVIVKTYPACRVATVLAADVKGKGEDRLFMPLFNHIQQQKISMTSPVVMDFAPSTAAEGSPPPSPQPAPQPPISMSFLYANEQIGQPGRAGVVTVHDVPPITVLSVGVRGRYDGAHFLSGMKAIDDYISAHPRMYEIAGTPRFLGYNSPFVPWFLRYGEVQVPVRRPAT
jgi:hypothetical protein